MPQQTGLQEELLRFSRVLVMLFNRATMYHVNHPFVKQSTEEFSLEIEKLLQDISPLVFLINRDQLFIDEEPIHAGPNANRIVQHFQKTGIQSISFDNGLTKNEIVTFLQIFTSLDTYSDADAMKKALLMKGVVHLRINHVFFKKVTEDDHVIPLEALKKLTPEIVDEEQRKSKKLFVDLVLENLLADELRGTLTVESLLRNPAGLSKQMTEAENAGSKRVEEEGGRPPGFILMRQLEILGDELSENLAEGETADLPEIAAALFEMKRRLVEGIEAQKSLKINYANEDMILDKVNDITDNVVLRIIKDEYKAGKTSISRLAQIIRRLVPDPIELKRLLPRIRVALMETGMSLPDYLHLVQELGKELQSEELASILRESSEEIGIDGETLIEEVRKNPVQAAELIFLASEIGKGSGDEQALTDLLVDYVERLGSKMSMDITEDEEKGKEHLRQIITSVESNIVGRLKKMDVKDDLLERLEDRFNKRIDEILERVKLDWLRSHAVQPDGRAHKELSVLTLMEKSTDKDDELGEILEIVRAKVQANEMDENNFGQIFAEISKQKEHRAQEMKEKMPKGVLKAPLLTLFIEKEVAKAERYGTPFCALSFSLIKAVPKSNVASTKLSYSKLMAAVFQRITSSMRDSDIVGELGRNRIVVLLPVTSANQGQQALRRYMKMLHGNVLNVNGTSLALRFAGVSTSYDPIQIRDAESFVRILTNELAQMEKRIKNIQAYF